MRRAMKREGGFSLAELLVSLAVFALATASLAGMMVQASRLGKVQQLRSDVQSNAASCRLLIEQDLRNAGWDPRNAGFAAVQMAAEQTDAIEIFADFNEDGDTDDQDEAVLVRWVAGRVEWRRSVGGPFETLAVNISNDADGDGVPEPMFETDSAADPSRVRVRITARSPIEDLRTGDYLRYTSTVEVALRGTL